MVKYINKGQDYGQYQGFKNKEEAKKYANKKRNKNKKDENTGIAVRVEKRSIKGKKQWVVNEFDY